VLEKFPVSKIAIMLAKFLVLAKFVTKLWTIPMYVPVLRKRIRPKLKECFENITLKFSGQLNVAKDITRTTSLNRRPEK